MPSPTHVLGPIRLHSGARSSSPRPWGSTQQQQRDGGRREEQHDRDVVARMAPPAPRGPRMAVPGPGTRPPERTLCSHRLPRAHNGESLANEPALLTRGVGGPERGSEHDMRRPAQRSSLHSSMRISTERYLVEGSAEGGVEAALPMAPGRDALAEQMTAPGATVFTTPARVVPKVRPASANISTAIRSPLSASSFSAAIEAPAPRAPASIARASSRPRRIRSRGSRGPQWQSRSPR